MRLYRINEQVWHDEVSILVTSLRRPLHEIATQWPGPASHVLFELSARLSIIAFGEAPFALRLPAVVFGVAGVVAFYWLALLLLRRDHAFALGMLYAVSYFHVWFSQNARGYTAMMLFFVLVSALLVRAWQRRRIERGAGIGYALAGAMTAYSHPVGLAVVPLQAAVAAVAARTAGRGTGQKNAFPLRTYLTYAAFALLLTALLYLPFVPSLLTFTRDVADAPGSGPRGAAGVLGAVIEGLSAATFGVGGLAAATAVGLIGLTVALRRFPFALALLVLPLVAQGVTFVGLGIGINPRYFAMALPVVVLIGGAGGDRDRRVAGGAACARAARRAPPLPRDSRGGGAPLGTAADPVLQRPEAGLSRRDRLRGAGSRAG
jgi:mannosyltransferase